MRASKTQRRPDKTNARANAHPYNDDEGSRTAKTASCLTCAILVMKRANAYRQGLAAVEEIEDRRREHLQKEHQ
ncbi:hypothetical protein [Streptomyces roseoverticillatus]|uniref:hypothetical protein n=1 Tax=Streptomyces roseoverticillatus TaxID=66429 RepID=UPI0012FEE5AB|nr:hypothetical protein [Streptomyces roseoverticillatus]